MVSEAAALIQVLRAPEAINTKGNVDLEARNLPSIFHRSSLAYLFTTKEARR